MELDGEAQRKENLEQANKSAANANPFSSGTVKGALYKEKSYYHGDTSLVIRVDKRIENIELVKQLFVLTFVDMDYGFIALGGETSIGRGLFDVKSIMIDGQMIHIEDYVRLEG